MGMPGVEWVEERTIGTKGTAFWWRADVLGNLVVRRLTQTGALKQKTARMVSRDDLVRLVAWLADREWVALESDPRKLRNGTAREGIGPFLHEELGWPPSYVVFASYVVTVLVRADVLAWDGRRREMRFRLGSDDVGRVRVYFEQRRAAQAAEAAAQADTPSAPTPQPPPTGILRPQQHSGGQSAPMCDLAEQFRARGRGVRARFDECASGLQHGQKGERREGAVREFLRRVLPVDFLVGRGEIVAASGAASRQIDALVYTRAARPLQETDTSVVVAAETACAAIEVKPVLDGHHLPDAMANVASAKSLDRRAVLREPGGPAVEENPPVFGAIFAFTSIAPTRLLDLMAEAEGDVAPSRGVDAVCLLDRGLIFRYPGLLAPPGTDEDAAGRRMPLCCTEAGEDSLGLFFLLLYYNLKLKRRLPPDLVHYAWTLSLPDPTMR